MSGAKGGTRTRKTDVIVVSHTHWDRAWYQPFQNLRSRLVHLVDELLEIFWKRKDFKVFNFDGQTVVVEDFLAIRPEKREDLRRLVKSGRMKIGPWYVLADEFLEGGEGLVRNLIIGGKVGAQFGGVMKVGYTPDSFGHVSQMPQILNGFGIDSFIFSRGITTKDAKEGGQVFAWKGPDGKSRVHCCWIPKGYGTAPFTIVVEDGKRKHRPWPDVMKTVRDYMQDLMRHKNPGVVLMWNGNDHAMPEERIGEMVRRANEEFGEYRFEHSSFDRYIQLVRKKSRKPWLYEGEFRYGGAFGLLSGTQSSRMYLKQANADCLSTLTMLTEPVCVMAGLSGLPYPSAEIDHAWKKVLKNHPHDDICGCSVDGVHRDMETRFRNCIELSEQLAYRSLYWLSHVARKPAVDGPRAIAGHGLPHRRSYPFSFTFDLPDKTPRTVVVNSEGRPQPTFPGEVKPQIVFDWDIRTGTFRERTVWQQEMEWLGELPPCGYEQFVPVLGENAKTDLCASVNTIENDVVSVEMNGDGSTVITDKKTGRSIVGNVFEDNEDSGDGYDYSRLAKSPATITSRGIKGTVSSRMLGTMAAEVSCEMVMNVPASLTSNHKARSREMVGLKIVTTARLLPGERRVEFKTRIENNAKDHRVRVAFQSGVVKADTVEAESAFDVVERKIDLPPKEETADWGQQPIPMQHVNSFVSVSDGKIGLTLINRGLPEYEARRDAEGISLVQTLFRAFSHLAMDDHFERGSAAGPVVPTPDAQMQGRFVAEYAVVVHDGTWEEAGTWLDAHAFVSPAGIMQAFTENPTGELPANGSFLSLDDPKAVVSAIKGAESGRGVVVRMWNIGSKPIAPKMTTLYEVTSASLTDMAEKPKKPLKHGKHHVKLPKIAPKEIVTVLLRTKPLAKPVKSGEIMWPTCSNGFRTY